MKKNKVSQGLLKKKEREARSSHTLRFLCFVLAIAKWHDLIAKQNPMPQFQFFHKWQETVERTTEQN